MRMRLRVFAYLVVLMITAIYTGSAADMPVDVDDTGVITSDTSSESPDLSIGEEDSDEIAVRGEVALSAFASLTDLRLTGILRSEEVLALTEELMSGDWERIRPLLVELDEGYPYAFFWYALPDGSYYTTTQNLTTSNLRDRPYFSDLLEGTRVVGPVVVSKSTGQVVTVVAVPLLRDGTTVGVIGASVYLNVLSRAVRDDLSLPNDVIFFAVDEEGQVVMHSQEDLILMDVSMLSNSTMDQAIEFMLSEDEGAIEYTIEGISWRAIFRSSKLSGWRFAMAKEATSSSE